MTLDKVKRGSVVQIVSIDDEQSRSILIRMGISEGSRVTCYERLPLGPVILRCKRQDIAIGRPLARCIHVIEDKQNAN